MRASFVSIWNNLWHLHRQTKDFFYVFAMPAKLKNESYQAYLNTKKEQEPIEPQSAPAFTKGKLIGLLLGPALFAAIMLFFNPTGLESDAKAALAVTAWIAAWWIFEPVPIPMTSILPVILMPLSGALTTDLTTSAYGNDIIFLFMGGFFIAVALEKWNLHKRLALLILSIMGTKTNLLLFGFMVATTFLSMWISASATVMMMVPMGLALLAQVQKSVNNPEQKKELPRFEKALLFGICYAGTIGGMMTIVGNPPNIIMVAQLREFFDLDIGFGTWMLFGVPVALIIIAISWVYLITVPFRMKMKTLPGGGELIHEEKKLLGKASIEEKWILATFLFTAFMWITRGFIWNSFMPALTDGMIAIFAAFLLFLIPAAKKHGGKILNWEDSKNIPWGVLILFGGGLAIAAGFQETGLSHWIGSNLTLLEGMNLLAIVTIATILVLILTEFTSNTATATILLPVMASVTVALGLHPFALMIPCVFAANSSFMLPVATPPNAIIFGTGRITIIDMIRVGFMMNVFALIVIVLLTVYYLPVVWGVDLLNF